MLQLSHATIDEVEKTTRCGYDDLYTMLEGAYLTAYIGSAIDCSNVESVDVLGETVEVIGYLETKLTGRTQDNGLCLLVLSIGLLNDRNAIGCSLASSCLRQGDDIVFVASEIGDYFFLYGHWILESKLLNSAANVLADA